MFHIKQTSTISDYIERFTDHIKQLAAYTPNPDILSYTTRFIFDLRDDIRPAVLIAHPPDLDSVCTLALLQEEAMEQGHKEFRKSDGSLFSQSATIKGALPLPHPPSRLTLPAPGDDKKPDNKTSTVDDKLSTLRSYRKVRGLCIAVVRSGRPNTVMPLCLNCMPFKRSGICARVNSMERVSPQILQLLSRDSCACCYLQQLFLAVPL